MAAASRSSSATSRRAFVTASSSIFSGSRRDRRGNRLEHPRQNVVVAKLLGALGHRDEHLLHGLARAVAPIAAKDQVDADDVIRIIAGSHLVAVGSRDHVDARLKPAIVTQRYGHRRLEID